MATSVPVPIAIPMSALASAGESLTPSPTIATFLRSFWSSWTFATLWEGRTSAKTFLIPTYVQRKKHVRVGDMLHAKRKGHLLFLEQSKQRKITQTNPSQGHTCKWHRKPMSNVFWCKNGIDYSPLHHYHREAGKAHAALGTCQTHQALTLGKTHVNLNMQVSGKLKRK